MKQKYWFMCYQWFDVFTFGIYDFFGDDIRAIAYCGSMSLDDYAKFENSLDRKL